MNPASSTPKSDGTAGGADAAEIARLEATIVELQDARVEDWVRVVRHGSVIPRSVETSLSWRLTRPVRLGETAISVLKRDGANRFWATVRVRLRRMLARS